MGGKLPPLWYSNLSRWIHDNLWLVLLGTCLALLFFVINHTSQEAIIPEPDFPIGSAYQDKNNGVYILDMYGSTIWYVVEDQSYRVDIDDVIFSVFSSRNGNVYGMADGGIWLLNGRTAIRVSQN